MSRSWAVLVAMLSTLLTVPAHAAPVSGWTPLGHGAQVITKGVPGTDRPAQVTPVDRAGRVLHQGSTSRPGLRAAATAGSALSTWDVTYDSSFDSNVPAHDAFQRAVDLWSLNVGSTVPITVSAHLTTFPQADQLGGAGPTNSFRSGALWYPVALANAASGRDLDTSSADIDANFAANPDQFYYGADPAGIATAQCTVPPATTPTTGSCYDFETLVLHELGHGLGFIGSADIDTRGTPSTTDDVGYFGVDYPRNTEPYVFDYFAETSSGRPITSYPNHSRSLLTALTGGSVYWSGAEGAAADRGREPRLEADAPFQSGTTYSHLAETSYPSGDPNGLMTPYVAQGDVIRDPGDVMLGMFRDMGWTTPALGGSRFTPLTPVRVLDTDTTPVISGQKVDVLLAGKFAVPADATAVVLNVTSSRPTADNVVRVYALPRANNGPVPLVSNVNTAAHDDRANLVTVALSQGAGRDGKIRLLSTGGSTRLVADLAGYYSPAADTAYHPLSSPQRVLDTRNGTGTPTARVGPGGEVTVTVTGGLVPSTATAVALTLTAVTPTAATYCAVYPTGTAPTVSNLNLRPGATAANAVVVKLPPSGQLTFRNNAGDVDLVADLAGYYDPAPGDGLLFRPTLPVRVLDTRPATLAGGTTKDITLTGAGYGVPDTATSAVVNVTGVDATRPTYLSAYATGTTAPLASNLNLAVHQTAASLAFVRIGSGGRIRVRNNAGDVGLVVDLSGSFGP